MKLKTEIILQEIRKDKAHPLSKMTAITSRDDTLQLFIGECVDNGAEK